jgi:hypothetical protein
MNFSIDKVAPPVAFVLVGLVMIVIGSSGTVPIQPYPEITAPAIKNLLVAFGSIFLVLGPLFFWYEIRKSNDTNHSDVTRNVLRVPNLRKKTSSHEQGDLVDPKLVHFAPPFGQNQFSLVNLPRSNPIKSAYTYKFAPAGIFVINDIPFSYYRLRTILVILRDI